MMGSPARRSGSLLAQVEHYLSLSTHPKPLHLIYATHPTWPFRPVQQQGREQVDVGVLDSSFNPPQLAHSALARSAKPHFADEGSSKTIYDSLLLIFSIRNADKGTGTSKDASTGDRLEMMKAFARDLEEQTASNVAVAIVEEPLMIAKSTLVHEYIERQRRTQQDDAETAVLPPVRLHWLVGLDTLERFFQVKYYPSPDFFHQACQHFFSRERTTFVCARRGLDSQPNRQGDGSLAESNEETLLESDHVKPWHERGCIAMMDLDEEVRSVSSTAVRRTIAEHGQRNGSLLEHKLRQLTTAQVAAYLVQESVYGSDN